MRNASAGQKLHWKNIPFCLEANDNTDLDLLGKLARQLSDEVHFVTASLKSVNNLIDEGVMRMI